MSLYFALLTLIFRARNSEDLSRMHRAAWTGAVFGLVALYLAQQKLRLDFGFWLYFHTAAALVFQTKSFRFAYSILVAAWIALESPEPRVSVALCALMGFATTLATEHLIIQRRALRLRTTLYWMTFIGTFFILLPAELNKTGSPLGIPRPIAWPLALGLVLLSIYIWRLTTQALHEARGTPDPSDSTQALRIVGIYRKIRNPMQLGHISAVWASMLFFGTWNHLFYAIGFCIFLTTVMRRCEENGLTKQFGESYLRYRELTPAYCPWTFRGQKSKLASL